MDGNEILKKLNTKEKLKLISGYQFMNTYPIKRLKIPSLSFADGPLGVRKQGKKKDNGMTLSLPSTAFPSPSMVASSFDEKNAFKISQAIAEECNYYGIDVLLSPGMNIKRNPLCGRNFEYYSEDPFLTSKFAISSVSGLQSKGISACPKHFALNNSENYRFLSNSLVDKRAMHEIYLRPFMDVINEANPHCIMTSYNKVNGIFVSENSYLLNTLLKEEWGYKGLVMSDWGGVHNRPLSLIAGLDLEMPGESKLAKKQIRYALKQNTISMNDINKAVSNVLTLCNRHNEKERIQSIDFPKHHLLAKEIAIDSAVLLKNNNNVLPLNRRHKYLIIGELFSVMRYQGSGSSLINSLNVISPKMAFDNVHINYEYLKGYHLDGDGDNDLLLQVRTKLSLYDEIIVFCGLNDFVESESKDRDMLSLPLNQITLINELIKYDKRIHIILFTGSPVELPFINDIDSLLNMYLPGEGGGEAVLELLFGDVSPSGRLTETWPLRMSDIPLIDEYSKSVNEIYKESIYVGYRYYETRKIPILFPFGYGLSYGDFQYSDFRVQLFNDYLDVIMKVKNNSKINAREVVEIYVSKIDSAMHRPIRELKGFLKKNVNALSDEEFLISVPYKKLSIFDEIRNKWVLEDGFYSIEVGKSVNDIIFKKEVYIKGEVLNKNIYREANTRYEMFDFDAISDSMIETITNSKIENPPMKPFTVSSKFSDLKYSSWWGRRIYKLIMMYPNHKIKKAKKMKNSEKRNNVLKGAFFMKNTLESNSLITMSMAAPKIMKYNVVLAIVDFANGRFFKGLFHLLFPFYKIKDE